MNKQDTLTESQRKAKEQFEEQRRQLDASFKRHLGPAAQKEKQRIERGGVNFALFNYILETTDFSGCNNSMDAIRETYKRFYIHLKKVVDENKELRTLLYKNIELLNDIDAKKVERIYQTESDPNDTVSRMLNKVRSDAKKRAKIGLKSYTPKK